MGNYWATYVKDSSTQAGKNMYFNILMERKDGKEDFVLYPNLIKNSKGQEGYSANPDAWHYLHKDIFSYISYADKMLEGEDTAQYRNSSLSIKDTIFYSAGFIVLDTVLLNPENKRTSFSPGDTAIMASLTVVPFRGGKKVTANPYLYLRNNKLQLVPDTLISQNLAVRINKIGNNKTFEIGVKESARMTPFIALKVMQFPLINLVWIGVVLVIIGFTMSMFRRIGLL